MLGYPVLNMAYTCSAMLPSSLREVKCGHVSYKSSIPMNLLGRRYPYHVISILTTYNGLTNQGGFRLFLLMVRLHETLKFKTNDPIKPP